jgi:hypothetical protein
MHPKSKVIFAEKGPTNILKYFSDICTQNQSGYIRKKGPTTLYSPSIRNDGACDWASSPTKPKP